MAKWEAYPTASVPNPLRPYVKRDYPMVMYRAVRPDAGGACIIKDSTLVSGDLEFDQQWKAGFYPTPLEAIDGIVKQELEYAKLAAARAFQERRMSPQAQAEAAAIDSETDQHVPGIAPTPIKRRVGRPAKPRAVAE